MREAAAGWYPATDAVEVLHRWWDDVMADDQHRCEGVEFGSAMAWSIAEAEADPERIAHLAAEVSGAIPNGRPQALTTIARPGPFPLGTLPDWVQDQVGAQVRRIPAPPEIAAMAALAVGSLAAVRNVKVVIETTWEETPNLYLAVVAQTGESKSPHVSAMMRPVEDFVQRKQAADADRLREQRAEHASACARRDLLLKNMNKDPASVGVGELAAAEAEVEDTEPPDAFLLLTEDATPEALAKLLQMYKKLGVISDEAPLLDHVAGMYSGTPNVQPILKPWGGDPIKVHRTTKPDAGKKIREVVVLNPRLVIFQCVQNMLLAKHMASSMWVAGRGVWERFMYVVPAPLVGSRTFKADADPEGTRVIRDLYYQRMTHLLEAMDASNESVLIHVQPEALNAYNDWRNRTEKLVASGGRFRHVAGHLPKIHGTVPRAAAVLVLFDRAGGSYADMQVTPEVMGRAIQLGDHWLDTVALLAEAAQEIAMLDKVIEFGRSTAEFTPRDISRKVKCKAPEARELLADLELRGWVVVLSGSLDGSGKRVKLSLSPTAVEAWDTGVQYGAGRTE